MIFRRSDQIFAAFSSRGQWRFTLCLMFSCHGFILFQGILTRARRVTIRPQASSYCQHWELLCDERSNPTLFLTVLYDRVDPGTLVVCDQGRSAGPSGSPPWSTASLKRLERGQAIRDPITSRGSSAIMIRILPSRLLSRVACLACPRLELTLRFPGSPYNKVVSVSVQHRVPMYERC